MPATTNPVRYWSDLKRQMADKEGFSELYDEIVGLKMPSADGKLRETDAANPETLFRIIQSIPSPKVEPFKRWLAKVAYERIQEIQNPEIAIKRAIIGSGSVRYWLKTNNPKARAITREEYLRSKEAA